MQKQFVHIPSFVVAKNRTPAVITGTYAELIRQRGGFPAQLFRIGGKSLTWMGHGNCTSALVQVMNSCGGNMIMMFLS